MLAGLTGWHLFVVLGAFIALFGAKKLPDAARAVGRSARIFKGEMRGLAADQATDHTQPGAPAAELPAEAAAPASPTVTCGRDTGSER